MFVPSKLTTKFFPSSFSSFFLLAEEHSRYPFEPSLHTASCPIFPIMAERMTSSGKLRQEALKVNTPEMASVVSSSRSSLRSSILIPVIWGRRPQLSSLGMLIHWMPEQPRSVSLAVRSPMVMVLLLLRETTTDLSTALTQAKISSRKEFSAVLSNLREMAPSERASRFGDMNMASTKLVFVSVKLSLSPQINRPSMMSSKRLFNLLESFTVRTTDLSFSISPLIRSEDPSIRAFSCLSSAFFRSRLFPFPLGASCSASVYVCRWHR